MRPITSSEMHELIMTMLKPGGSQAILLMRHADLWLLLKGCVGQAGGGWIVLVVVAVVVLWWCWSS